ASSAAIAASSARRPAGVAGLKGARVRGTCERAAGGAASRNHSLRSPSSSNQAVSSQPGSSRTSPRVANSIATSSARSKGRGMREAGNMCSTRYGGGRTEKIPASAPPVPCAPQMADRYIYRLRVRYSECDQQGVVFNAHYFAYFDDALTEVWRDVVVP